MNLEKHSIAVETLINRFNNEDFYHTDYRSQLERIHLPSLSDDELQALESLMYQASNTTRNTGGPTQTIKSHVEGYDQIFRLEQQRRLISRQVSQSELLNESLDLLRNTVSEFSSKVDDLAEMSGKTSWKQAWMNAIAALVAALGAVMLANFLSD